MSSWRFANVDGTPHPEDLPPPAEPQGPTTEEIDALIEQARQQARAEGFALGHAAGTEETRQALEAPMREAQKQAAIRFDEVMTQLHAELSEVHQDISRAVLDMACGIARQIVRRELSVDPQALQPVVNEALNLLIDDAVPATVRLNPQDLASMEAAWKDMPPKQRTKLIPDASIHSGGCKVESANTIIDATLEKRWTRAITNLGLTTTWEALDAKDIEQHR